MNIGQAAKLTGLLPETLRYYEDIELVAPDRSANGYRVYSEGNIQRLQFLKVCRNLGFSVEDCRLLLSLEHNEEHDKIELREIAKQKLSEVDQKISDLNSLKLMLSEMSK